MKQHQGVPDNRNFTNRLSNLRISGERRIPPNTVYLALSDRKTGILPVREDSASSLSAHEATGWKPVGHDRLEADPPAKLTVLGAPPAVGGILPHTLQPKHAQHIVHTCRVPGLLRRSEHLRTGPWTLINHFAWQEAGDSR